MAFLPPVKSVRREDLGPDAPAWVDNLLGPLTVFMEAIYSALNKQITIRENIAATIREFNFVTKSNYSTGGWDIIQFPSGLKTKPTACWVGYIQEANQSIIYDPVTVSWEDLSGDIRVNYITGLSNSTQYTVRLIVC